MSVAEDFRGINPFTLHAPAQQRVPYVFSSPHSGRHYPQRFLDMTRLDGQAIRRSEDFLVDLLFARVAELGAPLLAANFPRAYLDVNREAFELDPRMFHDALPSFANIGSARVAGGLGTVPRIVSEGQNIYGGKLAASEALNRIDLLYRPYHDQLRRLMLTTQAQFGHCVLVDCHSMPGTVRAPGHSVAPDFIIGDRFGTSASLALSDYALTLLRAMGFLAAYNKPYAGGFITEHYGRPSRGLHAIQIEINRSIYMNENTLEPKPGFDMLCEDIGRFAADLCAMPESWLTGATIAAE